MNTAQEIESLERDITQAKPIIEFGSALERLDRNKDFRAVIKEGYFKNEAIRLVHLKADPNMQTPEKQAAIIAQIDAIGTLAMYLNTSLYLADQARKSVNASEELRDAIIAEQSEVV